MTALMRISTLPDEYTKGPVIDSTFDIDGVTFVKPAPPLGKTSDFYRHGRPRRDTKGLQSCPPVALTLPALSLSEWNRFIQKFPYDTGFASDYATRQRMRAAAERASTPLKPLVPIDVTFDGWETWHTPNGDQRPSDSLRRYANALFDSKVRGLLHTARECTRSTILPHRYVLAVTEIIGQDQANDVSHIAHVRERPNDTQAIRPIVEMTRITRPHALALASAYAIVEGVESVLWQKDTRYAWQ